MASSKPASLEGAMPPGNVSSLVRASINQRGQWDLCPHFCQVRLRNSKKCRTLQGSDSWIDGMRDAVLSLPFDVIQKFPQVLIKVTSGVKTWRRCPRTLKCRSWRMLCGHWSKSRGFFKSMKRLKERWNSASNTFWKVPFNCEECARLWLDVCEFCNLHRFLWLFCWSEDDMFLAGFKTFKGGRSQGSFFSWQVPFKSKARQGCIFLKMDRRRWDLEARVDMVQAFFEMELFGWRFFCWKTCLDFLLKHVLCCFNWKHDSSLLIVSGLVSLFMLLEHFSGLFQRFVCFLRL